MPRTQRTPFVILGLLGHSSHQPRSGYELKKVIDTVVAHFWSESHGQLYPVLKQLAAEKLIRPVVKKETGREKILYAITPTGRARLRSWLETPVEASKPRNELILKLFFGGETDVAVLIRHLEVHREGASAALDQCLQWQKEATAQSGHDGPFQLITIRAGIAQCEASLRWAEESLQTLHAMTKTLGKRKTP